MTRELHIHVEEPSMEAFLEAMLPRILGVDIPRRIINHASKSQLMKQIPIRLRGYANSPVQFRPKSLILVDRDSDDCVALKEKLELACRASNLSSKSVPTHDGSFEVVNRIVVEELEAWYFGAVPALAIAFPGVPATLGNQQSYRDPDSIRGGTHEQLLKVLQKAGHFKGLERLPKIATARKMGSIIDPPSNKSLSFSHFLSGLQALAS